MIERIEDRWGIERYVKLHDVFNAETQRTRRKDSRKSESGLVMIFPSGHVTGTNSVDRSGALVDSFGTSSMPAWYKIDTSYKMVLSSGSGTVTITEMLEHQRKLFDDPDFDPTFSQLIDFTHVTKLDATADDFRALAEKSKFKHNARRAILVGK